MNNTNYVINTIDDVIRHNINKEYVMFLDIGSTINSYLADIRSKLILFLDPENHELFVLDRTSLTFDDFSKEDDFRITKLEETSKKCIFRKEAMVELVRDALKGHRRFNKYSSVLIDHLNDDYSIDSRSHIFAVMAKHRNLNLLKTTGTEIGRIIKHIHIKIISDKFAKIIHDIEIADNRPFKEVANEVLDNIETYGVEKVLTEME